jgi:hypothetical protein
VIYQFQRQQTQKACRVKIICISLNFKVLGI